MGGDQLNGESVTEHYSVDLDSTLFDTRHRHALLEERRKKGLPMDWVAYAKACINDKPTSVVHMVQTLQSLGLKWHVVSARSIEALPETLQLLELYDLHPLTVNLLEDEESHTRLGHAGWKIRRIRELAREYPIKLHIDDWYGIAEGLEQMTAGQIRGLTVLPPGMVSAWPDKGGPR